MVTQCLIHWVHEGRWDVWNASKVPAEIRHEGGLGNIKYKNGKNYLAKIIKMSDDVQEVEAAEEALAEKIANQNCDPPSKRKPKKPVTAGQASGRAVSIALGERPKLTTPQKEAKKKEAEAARARTAAQNATEAEEDAKLAKSVRQLFPSQNSDQILSDDDIASIDDKDDDKDDEDMDSSSDDNDNDNSKDREMSEFKNPNTVSFLQFLLKCFGTKESICVSPKNVYAVPVIQSSKTVRLKKKHSLMVDKGVRNMLVLDTQSQKSGTNFARKTFGLIYGEEQVKLMTAKGRKKGSLTASPDDLSTIYAFVTEYCPDLTWSQFVRAITKKCSSTKAKKEPSSSKKCSPAKKKKKGSDSTSKDEGSPSKKENKIVVEPLKSPLKTTEKSPIKSHSVIASPAKFQKSLVVTHTEQQSQMYQYNQHPTYQNCSGFYVDGMQQEAAQPMMQPGHTPNGHQNDAMQQGAAYPMMQSGHTSNGHQGGMQQGAAYPMMHSGHTGSGGHYPHTGSGAHYPHTGSGAHYPQTGSAVHYPHTASAVHYPHTASGVQYAHTGSGVQYPQTGTGIQYPSSPTVLQEL